MDYRLIALLSLFSYSLVAPTLKVAMVDMSSDVAVFVSNLVVLLVALGLAIRNGQPLTAYLLHPKTGHIVLVGGLIGISLLAFYRAIELGPLSVVVPIYGLFIVASSVIGIILLDEAATPRKILGIGLAMLAILLIAWA